MDTPGVPGLEPVFTTMADDDPDCPYIKVRSQRNADGSVAHVWEKWVAFSVEPLYLALFARYDPGMIVRRHGHFSPHTVVVLSGLLMIGDHELGAGGHVELPLGASFGPLLAGPQGAELYEVMMGDPRSWSDDEESMQRLLAVRGATQLPDPPIDLPAGLDDLRAVFGRAEGVAAETQPDS